MVKAAPPQPEEISSNVRGSDNQRLPALLLGASAAPAIGNFSGQDDLRRRRRIFRRHSPNIGQPNDEADDAGRCTSPLPERWVYRSVCDE